MTSSREKPRRPHPLRWLIEPLTEEADFFERPMFGCHACYLHGRLALVLAAQEEPWNGLLIPTEKQFHDSIMLEFIGVGQHPVLKKWLYLSQASDDFEASGAAIVEAVMRNDLRIGVEPREKSSKKSMRSLSSKRQN
ncbi:MAG: hypothetical protein EPN25_10260 [Nitrospirae bacterium]|nr:MAG: hypothetical protein EPN25_10260 [Nitrospirota bacterium]